MTSNQFAADSSPHYVNLQINAEDRGFKAALDRLSHSPNALQGLADLDLDLSDIASKLLRIEVDKSIAEGAGNMTVGFYPSDFLIAHLRAHGASDF